MTSCWTRISLHTSCRNLLCNLDTGSGSRETTTRCRSGRSADSQTIKQPWCLYEEEPGEANSSHRTLILLRHHTYLQECCIAFNAIGAPMTMTTRAVLRSFCTRACLLSEPQAGFGEGSGELADSKLKGRTGNPMGRERRSYQGRIRKERPRSLYT